MIALRTTNAWIGRDTDCREARLMVSEKMLAFAEAATTMAMGGSAHMVVKAYRRKVRANTRRLKRC